MCRIFLLFFTVDFFRQVQNLRSAVSGLAMKCLADMFRYLKKDMVAVSIVVCASVCMFAGSQRLVYFVNLDKCIAKSVLIKKIQRVGNFIPSS